MIIADHSPVYPRVKLARYDKLNALNQAAQFLHADAGLDLQQARSSLLASAAADSRVIGERVAFVHATDPDCTQTTVMVLTLRRPIMWQVAHAPIDYLVVARVPQLTDTQTIAGLRTKAQQAVAANAEWFDQWWDDPVALGLFADDIV